MPRSIRLALVYTALMLASVALSMLAKTSFHNNFTATPTDAPASATIIAGSTAHPTNIDWP